MYIGVICFGFDGGMGIGGWRGIDFSGGIFMVIKENVILINYMMVLIVRILVLYSFNKLGKGVYVVWKMLRSFWDGNEGLYSDPEFKLLAWASFPHIREIVSILYQFWSNIFVKIVKQKVDDKSTVTRSFMQKVLALIIF